MPRYFSKPAKAQQPKAEWWWEDPVRNMPYVCDHEATSTGLLDKNGDTIWRAPNPIGFIWD